MSPQDRQTALGHSARCSGSPKRSHKQRQIARGGLQKYPFGHIAQAMHMHAAHSARLILMRKRPLQKFASAFLAASCNAHWLPARD